MLFFNSWSFKKIENPILFVKGNTKKCFVFLLDQIRIIGVIDMSCFVFRQFLMDSYAGTTMTLIIMSSSHQGEFHSTLFFPALHYLLLQTLHSTDSTPSWHRIIAILLTNDKVSKYCSHTPPSMFRIQLGPKFFVRK